MLPILAAAIMALPLPEGRGGPRLVPLEVTAPAGAVATVRFRDAKGAERVDSCTAPCTLRIARASPFVFDVELNGRPLRKPALAWGFRGLSGPNIYPNPVALTD